MCDFLNAMVNSIVFCCFNIFLDAEDFMGEEISSWVIYLQLAMVLISWIRFLSFFLVISAISRLIMTLIKMLVSCFTFLFIVICYLILMTPIFFILFQETTTACIDPLRTLIFLYDSYLGVFAYE